MEARRMVVGQKSRRTPRDVELVESLQMMTYHEWKTDFQAKHGWILTKVQMYQKYGTYCEQERRK